MKKILFLLLVLFSAAFPALAQPQTLTVAGLQAAVTVRRDARAIPYIEAENEADLYFAQGYVTASDRLFQMDLMRRVARGETAEIFGRAALEEDKRWRRMGFSQVTAESYRRLAPELKAALDNYARGVNAYIAALKAETMPVEYNILGFKPREWLPVDSLVIGKILADGLSNTWRQDLTRVAIGQMDPNKAGLLISPFTARDVVLYGKDSPPIIKLGDRKTNDKKQIPQQVVIKTNALLESAQRIEDARRASLERVGFYAEDQAASNNWVISGKRTADGKPILANDPHLFATAPGIWYLSHLSTPQMRAGGVVFPGVPGIILGHNEYIAWGATNLGPDVQGLYIETFDPQKPEMYKTPAGWEKAAVRREKIKVRKNPLGPVTDADVEDLEVTETRNGVIIMEDAGKKYALKWTARDPKNTEIGGFYYVSRAKNWKQFNAALNQYGGPTQNFVYADTQGNIGWHNAGAIPTRRKGDGSVPYDGATSDGDWTGDIPYSELPNLYNPRDGFIVTANQRVVGTGYKYFSVLSRDAARPWRARRIYDMIAARQKITMDDCRDIQIDVFNIPLTDFAAEVARLEGASAETLAAMKSWDGRMAYDSKTALLVNEIRNVFAQKLGEANLLDKNGKRLEISAALLRERAMMPVLKGGMKDWLPKGYASFKDLLLDSEKQAQANLNALAARLKIDRENLVWGNYFAANFMHPLAAAPLIGGQFTVRPAGVSGSGQTPNVGTGVSMRLLASPGNWDATRHVIPLGQSGDPRSPHWKDQFESWRTGKPEIFPFSKEAVEKAATSVTIMKPGKTIDFRF